MCKHIAQKKLTIALALEIFHPEINGVVTSSINMLSNLKKRGHKPVLFAPMVTKNSPKEIHDIPVHYLPSLPTYVYPGLHMVRARTSQMRRLFNYYRFDIAHLTAPWRVNRAIRKNAEIHNIPIVHTYHTNLHHPSYINYLFPFVNRKGTTRMSEVFWRSIRPYINPCAYLTSPSHLLCDELSRHFPRKNIYYIPNGVAVEDFSSPIDEELFKTLLSRHIPSAKTKPYTPFYFLFVGRLGFEKSVDILIRGFIHAFRHAKTHGITFDYHLVLIGDGPARAKLEEIVHEETIQSHVHFFGKLDHDSLIKGGIITRARAFATASLTEVQSMTVIEAICSETPLIAADHPSMTNLAADAARYFIPDNIQDLAKAFLALAQDDAYYTSLKNATRSLKENFNGETVALQHEALYYQALETKKRGIIP